MPFTLLKTSVESQHQSKIHGNISINMTSGKRQETSYSSVVNVILYILKGTKRQEKQMWSLERHKHKTWRGSKIKRSFKTLL